MRNYLYILIYLKCGPHLDCYRQYFSCCTVKLQLGGCWKNAGVLSRCLIFFLATVVTFQIQHLKILTPILNLGIALISRTKAPLSLSPPPVMGPVFISITKLLESSRQFHNIRETGRT